MTGTSADQPGRCYRLLAPTIALLGALVIGGCSGPTGAPSSTGSNSTAPSSTGQNSTAPNSTAPNSTAPATASPSAQSPCQTVLADAGALGAAVARFVGGTATADEVRGAAQRLSTALDTAQATIGPQASAALHDAQAAVRRLLDALQARPVDPAAVRTAGGDTVAVVQRLATSCQPTTA